MFQTQDRHSAQLIYHVVILKWANEPNGSKEPLVNHLITVQQVCLWASSMSHMGPSCKVFIQAVMFSVWGCRRTMWTLDVDAAIALWLLSAQCKVIPLMWYHVCDHVCLLSFSYTSVWCYIFTHMSVCCQILKLLKICSLKRNCTKPKKVINK